MDAFTPQQTTELVSRIGCKKSHMRLDKLFINSCLASPRRGVGGVLPRAPFPPTSHDESMLAFETSHGKKAPLTSIFHSCAVLLSTEAAPWYQENAPGLIRSIASLFFPIGLVMIVLSGADLFTTNVMFMLTAYLHGRRIGIKDLAITWVVSYFGNLAGMLFFMAIITGYGGVYAQQPYKQQVFDFATMKMLVPRWHQIFLRAIGANWLVCFAVFISISSREVVSKIMAIWWPTFTFVALGLDHVIANMYFIPTAIFYGHPDIGVGLYIWKSMIPTALGNIVGGGLFVGAAYWYLYLTGLGDDEEIKFDLGGLDTAMDVGGPMGDLGRKNIGQRGAGASDSSKDMVIDGKDPNCIDSMPSSDVRMGSGIGRELNADTYTKSKNALLVANEKV